MKAVLSVISFWCKTLRYIFLCSGNKLRKTKNKTNKQVVRRSIDQQRGVLAESHRFSDLSFP